MSSFTAEVFQNEFLPLDGSEVNAIVTISSSGSAGVAEPAGAPPVAASAGAGEQPDAAEIVIIDTSGSMDVPRTKILAARDATSVAIDCIRDGVAFGVISGTARAHQVYPGGGQLVAASEATRYEAKQAVSRLMASGGTAIGSWLGLARDLFGVVPGRVCHAILLTDGENRNETPEELDAVLESCDGVFQCDCRGVGTDWVVSELRRVSSKLLGSLDIIADPANMADDFRSMIGKAMGKATKPISLRLWTPQGTAVAFVRQVAPTIEELTDRAVAINPLTSEYPTGTWGEESRDYHVCVKVQPRGAGEEMLAGRVSLLEGDEVLGQGLIKAVWTEDQALSTRINREVAHYTGQAELADAIQEGLEARKAGDEATATFKLGRAVQLASESGNDGTMKLLGTVVDVDDAATGTVRLKKQVDDADEMALDTRSTKTVRVGSGQLLSVTCPNGHQSATTDYCDQCGAPIQAAPTPPPTSVPGAPHTATLDAVSGGDEVDTSPAPRQQPCPQCGAPRTGDDRYCEGCGYDFIAAPGVITAAPADAGAADAGAADGGAGDAGVAEAGSGNGPAPGTPVATWEAVTSADRAQFDRLAPAGLEFPTDYPERHFPLTGKEVVIGRTHPPAQPPDINLAGAPEDPAVSHRHAQLERQDDGSYKLRDIGSTNGTTLNDDPTPISRDTGVPVADGDRIHLGAWTTLTLRRRS